MDVHCEHELSRHQQPLVLLRLDGVTGRFDCGFNTALLLLHLPRQGKLRLKLFSGFGLVSGLGEQLSSLFRAFRPLFHTFFLLLVKNLG